MGWINEELRLDPAAQEAGFRQYWNSDQVRIVCVDDIPVGWLQSFTTYNGELFLGQIIIETRSQGRGVGTQVMHHLIAEGTRANQPVVLSVAKINPARRLYERLGFQITHEDERKFYMRREVDANASV